MSDTKERPLTHYLELLSDFGECMLVTSNDDVKFHGRPMSIARVEENGVIYLSTSLNSPKAQEIEESPDVAVFFQKPRCYLALYGSAQIVRDRALIEELWQESWKVWFPEGKASPDLCLLRISPTKGEYWDMQGMNGIQFLFDSAKSYLTGKKQDHRGTGNAKVAM